MAQIFNELKSHPRFGNDVIDDDTFQALIGNAIVSKDGTKHRVDDATADAVRRTLVLS